MGTPLEFPTVAGGEHDPAVRVGGPAHSVRPLPRPGRIAAAAGAVAALAAVGLGTLALIRLPAPTPATGPTLQPITVASAPVVTIPLSDPDILALLRQSADFGPLTDAQRRASCLTGLGYPAGTRVLGARPIDINGHGGVLLVLPGQQVDTVVALAVGPSCSAADTRLLADTVIHRP